MIGFATQQAASGRRWVTYAADGARHAAPARLTQRARRAASAVRSMRRRETGHVHGYQVQRRCGQYVLRRNLDWECSYGERPIVVPRGHVIRWAFDEPSASPRAIVGMGVVGEGLPLYFDCANEDGLAVAGLNFPHLASYAPEPVDDARTWPPTSCPCGSPAGSRASTRSSRRWRRCAWWPSPRARASASPTSTGSSATPGAASCSSAGPTACACSMTTWTCSPTSRALTGTWRTCATTSPRRSTTPLPPPGAGDACALRCRRRHAGDPR